MANYDSQAPAQFITLDRLSIFTPTPGHEGNRAKVTFGFRNENPRISVFTNDPNDLNGGKTPINCGVDPATFITLLDQMEAVVKADQPTKIKFETDGTRYENNERTKDRQLLSTLFFGKDDSGVCWISVQAENRPRIKFEFKVSDWHRFFKSDGSKMSIAEASAASAMSMILIMRQMTVQLLSHYKLNPQPIQLDTPKPASSKSSANDIAGTITSFDTDIDF